MEAVRSAICVPPPAPLPPVPTTQIYWCIGRVCARANVVIDAAPQKESTYVIQEYLEVPPPILVSLLLFGLIMIVLAFRLRCYDAASFCVSACISMSPLISALASSAGRTLHDYHHLGYQKVEGFVRRCYQSIRDLAYELHPPILSAASSEDDCASPHTDTDKTDLASQQSPILDASSSEAKDSDLFSEDAKKEILSPDQSPVIDDIDRKGFATQPGTIIHKIETDQGSSRTKSGSSTFSPNGDEANPTDAHESSILGAIANKDDPSSPYESSLHDAMDEDPTSEGDTGTPNDTTKEADSPQQTSTPTIAEPTSNPNPGPASPLDSMSDTSSNQSDIPTISQGRYAPLLDLTNIPGSDTDQDWDEATAVAIQQRCERALEMIAKGEIPSRRDQKALRKFERVVGRGFRGS